MGNKHRKNTLPDKIHVVKDYTKSNHTRNNYRRFVKSAKHEELLSEYNKIGLLIQMMKVGNMKGMKPYEKGRDNIDILKYKYNLVCQEMTVRNYRTIRSEDRKRYTSM
jgi:hypothetical protein